MEDQVFALQKELNFRWKQVEELQQEAIDN